MGDLVSWQSLRDATTCRRRASLRQNNAYPHLCDTVHHENDYRARPVKSKHTLRVLILLLTYPPVLFSAASFLVFDTL